MKRLSVCLLVLPLVLVCACTDETQPLDDDPYTSDPDDPVICVGDPDTQIVCKKESDFWDCTAMPNGDKKCGQKQPVVPPGGGGSWTCTVQEGKLVCQNPSPDAGPGGSSDWSCTNNAKGGTTCTKKAPVPPGGGTWNCGYDKEFNWSCTKTGPSPDGGTIKPPPGTSKKICYFPKPGNTTVTPPEGYWAMITAKKSIFNGVPALYVRLTLTKAYVDNTYGDWSIGYSGGPGPIGGGHSLGDLAESDKAEIFINNYKGDLLQHMVVDYISASSAAKSGYACLGVTGGEGSMTKGKASDVMAAQSSLAVNFNGHGYVLLKNSPKTDMKWTPNPSYPKWIFEVWYEVWVKWSAYGASGPGKVYITGLHASPNKVGGKLEMLPGECPPGTN